MRKILYVLMIFWSSGAFSSSSINNAKIQSLGYDKSHNNIVFIRVDKAIESKRKVKCHVNHDWHYTLKISTPFDEKMYSALLAAQASKQNLTLIGSGKCDAFSQIESLNVLYSY